jgi:hypothetical protein
MTQITINFTHILQDSQDFGSDSDHMVSRVFFSVEQDGSSFPGCFANLKQTVGGDVRDDLEVSRPQGYKGPFNFTAFQDAAQEYFRQGIYIGPGAGMRNLRMRNNTFRISRSFTFEATQPEGSW